MAKEKLSPKRRFKEFRDIGDWEQRKFNDCFNFPVSTNSLSRAMLNYDNGEIKNIHYGDILIKYSTILNVKEDEIPYITGGELEKYKSNLLDNQDLIFADAAEDESVGKAVEVSGITNENLVSGLHTIVARAKGEKAPFFWGYYINSDIYHRQLLRLMQGSKVSAISKGNLQETNVSFPIRMKEQQEIGSFFKHLDETITLHQRKLKKLRSLKVAYLAEMFPVAGETKPKRRFEGFIDDWEQRKLGDIVNLENGYAFKSDFFIEKKSDTIVLTPGNVKIGGGFQEGKGRFYNKMGSFPDKFIFKPNDIFLTMTDLTPSAKALGYPATVPDDGIKYLHNQRLGKLTNILIDREFLFQLLSTDDYHKDIVSTASGTTVKHSSVEKILGYETNIPSMSEQKKISAFFKQLDNTIALHQRKLEKLQNLKRAYLNEMFV